MKIKEYSKSIVEQITSGIQGTGYRVYGPIQIHYQDGDNKVIFEITNHG